MLRPIRRKASAPGRSWLCFTWLALCSAVTVNERAPPGLQGAIGFSGRGGGSGGGLPAAPAVHPRLEITQLMTHPPHDKQRVLFLLALRQQQLRPASDPASYYQLLGIHGAPFKVYRGVAPPGLRCDPSKQWCGYCHHGDSLFPTWHRTYLLHLERQLAAEAAAVAARLARAQPGQADAWRAAAAALRVPYWEFAGRAAARHGVPRSFVQETVAVLDPDTGKPAAVPNPLRQYLLPLDTGSPRDLFPRFSRAGTPTLRWPDGPAFAASNDRALNASVLRNSAGRWRESVRAVLTQRDWRCFSNHEAPLREPGRCPALASLEFLHDLLHEGLGGPRGHLAHTGISAFDPLFLLIHSSIDRLLAIWQLAHPGAAWAEAGTAAMGTRAVPKGSVVDAHTPLVPFYAHNTSSLGKAVAGWGKGTFVTSAMLRDWRRLAYTYPDVDAWEAAARSPADLLARVLDAYR